MNLEQMREALAVYLVASGKTLTLANHIAITSELVCCPIECKLSATYQGVKMEFLINKDMELERIEVCSICQSDTLLGECFLCNPVF